MSCARTPERDDNGAGIISVLPPLVPSGGHQWDEMATNRQAIKSLCAAQSAAIWFLAGTITQQLLQLFHLVVVTFKATDHDGWGQGDAKVAAVLLGAISMNYCYNTLVLRKEKSWQIYYSYGFWYYSNICFCLPKKTNKKENRYSNSIPHAELVLHPLFS
jgi:hypothetical protein